MILLEKLEAVIAEQIAGWNRELAQLVRNEDRITELNALITEARQELAAVRARIAARG